MNNAIEKIGFQLVDYIRNRVNLEVNERGPIQALIATGIGALATIGTLKLTDKIKNDYAEHVRAISEGVTQE